MGDSLSNLCELAEQSGGYAAPVAPDLTRLVKEWIRYARTGETSFSYADTIQLSVGGHDAGTITDPATDIDDRRTWRRCPDGSDSYGASSCPVDFLSPVHAAVANDHSLVYTSSAGPITCSPTPGPISAEGRLVLIRPEPQWRTCSNDFAITLAADQQGRLTAVDIALSAP